MIVPVASGATESRVPRRPVPGPLVACLFAVAVQVLDMTMLATALPAVTRELRLPAPQQVLVISGYSLAFGCLLLAGAQFGDRFGRRRAYLTGMAGFAVAAGWCATAGSGPELIAGRCVQGLCAALVAAQTLAILTASYGPRRRVTAFTAQSATGAAVAVAGPVLGGILVDADLGGIGWRSAFLAELVLAVVAVAVALRYLPGHQPTAGGRFDPVGAGLVVAVVGTLLYLAMPVGGPRSVTELALGAGCAAVLLPVIVHRGRGPQRAPAFPAGLFTRREFALGAVALVGFSALFAGVPVTVSSTVQLGLGFSARQAGMLLLPSALGAVAGALTAPILVRRWGHATLTAGMLLFGLAALTVAVLLDPGSGRIELPALVLPLAVAGVGLGWFAAPLTGLLMSEADPADPGPASGLVPTLQQWGGALGPAVLLARPGHGSPEPLPAPASGPAGSGAELDSLAVAQSYLAALDGALWIVTGVAAALAAVVLALPGRR
ncbi:MFS transporter [Nocardia sp. CA-290969]|uniref:MFS transporter n=1 Tax=Nocardia sp. CA-290969 TaxID=3239986 RepID=UPI003D928C5B